MITHRRIQTGITGLDNCIEGGLPQGSITVLAGSPGTGKTILSATYLNYGALVNEKGLYVSIGEGKDRFTVNMGLLGIDFEHHEKSE